MPFSVKKSVKRQRAKKDKQLEVKIIYSVGYTLYCVLWFKNFLGRERKVIKPKNYIILVEDARYLEYRIFHIIKPF